MADFNNFKIKRGPSELLKSKLLIIEEGCWYLSTDTAELFIGIVIDGVPQLKQINGDLAGNIEVDLTNYYTKDDIDELIEGIELKEGPAGKDGKDFTYDMFTEEQLTALKGETGEQGPVGPVGPQGEQGPAGKDGTNGKDGIDGKDGLTTAIKIGEAIYEHVDGTISLPEFLTEHQSLDGYATEQYVIEAIANQVPVEKLASKSEVLEVKTTLEDTILPKVNKVDEIVPVVETLKTTAATQE
jgi:hypothetical protein